MDFIFSLFDVECSARRNSYYYCLVNHHNRHYPKDLRVVSPESNKNLKNTSKCLGSLGSLMLYCLPESLVSLRTSASSLSFNQSITLCEGWNLSAINHPYGENKPTQSLPKGRVLPPLPPQGGVVTFERGKGWD